MSLLPHHDRVVSAFSPFVSLPPSQRHEPRLPPELEETIFRSIAHIDHTTWYSLSLTARRVYQWIVSIRYEAVTLGQDADDLLVQSLHRHPDRWALIQRVQLRWTSQKGYSPLDVVPVLKKMPHLQHLAVWSKFDLARSVFLAIHSLPITNLALHSANDFERLAALLSADELRPPLSLSLTHLFLGETLSTEYLSRLSFGAFPALTHLCISPNSPENNTGSWVTTMRRILSTFLVVTTIIPSRGAPGYFSKVVIESDSRVDWYSPSKEHQGIWVKATGFLGNQYAF
ncbi:hypothetical protein DL96DRAFT_1820877 [Flagelloscypha sp. PMI_526]|nr:hypothetical protein DL96DRAFT_1820877 [Flagelloscypha sp. PMI_526]